MEAKRPTLQGGRRSNRRGKVGKVTLPSWNRIFACFWASVLFSSRVSSPIWAKRRRGKKAKRERGKKNGDHNKEKGLSVFTSYSDCALSFSLSTLLIG